MTQTIQDNLQVNGSLNLRDDLMVGGTLQAVSLPAGPIDYMITLVGSTPTSLSPNSSYLNAGQQSIVMNNPGINTVVLLGGGAARAKASHNVSQDPSQWNSWADWVNSTATNGDVVAVASYGVSTIPPPPPNGSAARLLVSIQASFVSGIPPLCPFALLFIKGQARAVGTIGSSLPAPPYPPGTSTPAVIEICHSRLLKPFCGNVGIGTDEPDANLHIVGSSLLRSVPLRVVNTGAGVALSVTGGETELVARGVVLSVKADAQQASAEFFPSSGSGNVGIGTSSPGAPLDIVNDSNAMPQLRLQSASSDTFISLKSNNPGGREYWLDSGGTGAGVGAGNLAVWDPRVAAARLVIDPNGNVGIGTVTPQAKLHVVGDINATGDIVLANADCAEEFVIEDGERMEPGTVMVLGQEGSLRQSTKAYDKKVAGVISGAGDFKPGVILDRRVECTHRMAISLMGKAYCKVDAQYAPIEAGDLLTTSPTAGHAMKATDPVNAFGTVIGKALKPLEKGTGLIPILISLQ